MRQDQPQRGCILQPNVAVAATLGTEMKFVGQPQRGCAGVESRCVSSSTLRKPATTLSGLGKSLLPESQGSRKVTPARNQIVDRACHGRLEFAPVELVLLTERTMTLVKIIVITVLIILSILLFGRFLF